MSGRFKDEVRVRFRLGAEVKSMNSAGQERWRRE